MPEKIITPEKKPAAGVPPAAGVRKVPKFGSRKTHSITREAVLQKLESEDFIADQLKHVARAK